MRGWMIVGCTALLAVGLNVNCGGDKVTTTAAATTGATGGSNAGGGPGSGGAGGTGAQGPGPAGPGSGGAPTTTTNGAGGFTGNTCEQACQKVDACGLPGGCGLAGIDCNDPAAECPGQCILDADCGQILSIVGGTPDPTLVGCIQGCQGGAGGAGGNGQQACVSCGAANCLTEAQTCQGVQVCNDYLNCLMGCTDSMCGDQCLMMFDSPESQALQMCVCAACSMDCTFCP